MSDFDAIVVGSGLAGASAAIELARAGKSVLVVERGNFSGAKNMTGGRIYTHSLYKLFPDGFEDAPLERKVTHERISLMSENSNMTIEFSSDELDVKGRESYTILRAPFDEWMQAQAEEAGAEYINGIAVEQLVKDEDGKVIGILAGEDEVTADVVLLCDGVNSLLTGQAVGYARPPASMMAVGVKDVFALPEEVIDDRFGCAPGEGAAWLFAGDATHGLFGGGIIYKKKAPRLHDTKYTDGELNLGEKFYYNWKSAVRKYNEASDNATYLRQQLNEELASKGQEKTYAQMATELESVTERRDHWQKSAVTSMNDCMAYRQENRRLRHELLKLNPDFDFKAIEDEVERLYGNRTPKDL